MGVKGLWQIISNSGKPIPLETLEHKILAVDVSIWLYQAVYGIRGLAGSSVANAHLLLLFHRICKLLFYGIKPVFVFDGGVPHLKKKTVAARRLKREIASKKSNKVRERLLSNLLKGRTVRNALGKRGPGPMEHCVATILNPVRDMFDLPALPDGSMFEEDLSEGAQNNEEAIFTSVHDFDNNKEMFKDLPLQTKHEIMCDLEVTRKENSWNCINEMPQESNLFSRYQMERLLKRNQFQTNLDKVRLQIQKDHSAELEAQLFGELEEHVSLTHRIVSEDAYSVIVNTKSREDPVEPILAEQKIVKKQKTTSKIDFLTELTKQGIVSQDHLSENSDSDISDEEQSYLKKQNKLEQISFMKALNCVLDNQTELSQDEIYSLIKKSQQDVVNEEKPKFDIDKPSTSKQSEMWQDNLSSSDDDFIDVPEPGDSAIKSPEGREQSKSNIDAIKQSKSGSLFLKIIQQKLEDIKPATGTSNRQGLSPEKSQNPDRLNISFDMNSCKPLANDIFSDIFSNTNFIPSARKNQNNPSEYSTAPKQSQNKTTSNKSNFTDSNEAVSEQSMDMLSSKVQKYISQSPDRKMLLNGSELSEFYSDAVDATCVEIGNKINSEFGDKYSIATNSLLNVKTDGEQDSLDVIVDTNTYLQRNIISPTPLLESNDNIKLPDNLSGKVLFNSENVEKINKDMVDIKDKNEMSTPNINQINQLINHDSNILLNDFKRGDAQSHNIQGSVFTQVENSPPKDSKIDLTDLESNLETEQRSLVSEMQTLHRAATSISEQKFQEAQELLRLFGIPYIVAPMEAESQCAFLNSINLTHGTITDDSDIFLFGGRHVYKNFFNHMKHVEMFDSVNIHRTCGLNRMKMIQFAQLTGSDYTMGIESVGAVMAMELLSSFPAEGMDGLLNLRKTWLSLQKQDFSLRTASKLSKLHIPESFPNKQIFDAYLQPEVDSSNDKFSWGLPNVEELTKFTADKFGWNVSKTSEILVPVLKKIENKSSQRRLESYFNHITLTKEPEVKSKRLLEAIKMSTTQQGLAHSDVTQSNRKTILLTDPPTAIDPKSNKRQHRTSARNLTKKSKSELDKLFVTDDTITAAQPLTKDEKKQQNFDNLLKETKIPQVEKEKLEKAEKLQRAINILRKKS